MTTNTETTIQRIAREASAQFHTLRDDKGEPVRREGVEVMIRDSNADDALQAMCREAHGDMFPDDWRYSFIVEALNMIEENENLDDCADEIYADVYTSDRLAWLASHLERAGYVDEAVNELGIGGEPGRRGGFSVLECIAFGQIAERREVFEVVRAWCEAQADEADDEA